MKIWISKNSEVPVREQLITQITLGIAAGDYAIGQKLPSTREVARRCGLHANTVSSAYQQLAKENLLEFRKGSGFYVAESASVHIEGSRKLEDLIASFLESAERLGFTRDEIVTRLRK
jgi:DNA-binding transcriptional regulator YhcF (GntR family)